MSLYDLTTLADVKAWLARSDTNSDALLAALITRASREILSYLQRPLLLPHSVTELQRADGHSHIVLREWPVTSVASVAVGRASVPEAATPLDSGWLLEAWNGAPPGRPQGLNLAGWHARGPIEIVYQAGYQVTNEAQTIAGGAASASAPFGAWAMDAGVTYADGIALACVASAPAQGQYAFGPTPGDYLFNAADDGQSVRLTYGFVPFDLADAAIELVAERYKYAQRIGEKTHSLGGNETVSFDNTRFTPLVTSLLQPYRRVTAR